MKKILLIIFILFMASGCKAEYNLTIDDIEKFTYEETGYLTANNKEEFLGLYDSIWPTTAYMDSDYNSESPDKIPGTEYYEVESYQEKDIKVDYIKLEKNNILNKKQGDYITISFQDITDINNFQMVLKVLEKELLRIFSLSNIKKEAKCLIIGLGNSKSTPDSLGYETVKNIIVTRHLYELGEVDKKYRNVSVLEPNVIGNTGIESRDVIMGVIKETTPDFIIAIDSLSASNIERIQKTIQITNTGIQPGSGIGNNRGELSIDTIKIPVIAIGVPTVVSSAVIVHDTINYLIKKVSYHKKNFLKDKLTPSYNINYLKASEDLTIEEKKELLGLVGGLNEEEIKELIYEVLNPIGYNLIVSTKEIDFIIEKLGKLLGDGLNSVLHEK